MSTTVVCPHCRGKVRLRSSAAPRVRCLLCGKGFDNPTATVVSVELLFQPLFAAPEEAPAVESPPPDLKSEIGNPVTALGDTTTDPAPDAPAFVRFEPDPILTIPRKPTSAARRAAARRRLRARHLSQFKVRDYVVAVSMLLCGVILVGGVFYILFRDGPPTSAGTTVAAANGTDGAGADAVEPQPAVVEPALPDRSLSSRLFGVWELRSDDDSTGFMEFREDGTAIVQASAYGFDLPFDRVHWLLVAEAGDELTVDLVTTGPTGNHRLILHLTCPEALTLVRTLFGDEILEDAKRFVRRADVKVVLPPHPDVP